MLAHQANAVRCFLAQTSGKRSSALVVVLSSPAKRLCRSLEIHLTLVAALRRLLPFENRAKDQRFPKWSQQRETNCSTLEPSALYNA